MIASSLKVLLWGSEVGRLSWDDRRGLAYFEFGRDFMGGSLDPFPIAAPIASPASRRPILGDRENRLYRGLPPFIADSLPDAWGNQVFDCWRKEQGLKNKDVTPLDILSFIGKRGMGALEFEPEEAWLNEAVDINLQALRNLARRIFEERENAAILPGESLTMQSLLEVGTSAGGRQPKAVIAVNRETGEIRSGQIAGREGFEYCLLKFGNAERSSAEIEMAYSDMAVAAGIDMTRCRLLETEGEKHFVTARFDREGGRKIHMQTLAALYPGADSYEQLLLACRKLRLPEQAQEEVFRRMVFNILANNSDDHNKNFSFLMSEEGEWSLSPAYDLTYIFNAGGFLPEASHCLLLRGKLSGQTMDDALALAAENGIRDASAIINRVASALSQFRDFALMHGVRDRWIGAIESTINQHLYDWGLKPTKKMFP